MNLKGKTALVTGAARRVGRVIALALAGRGANVAVHFNTSGADAERTAAEVRALGVECMTVQADLRKEAEVHAMMEAVARKYGGIDALVNNAAVFFKTPVATVTAADWDRTIDPNLKAVFLCSVIAGRLMMEQPEGGAIVSIADTAGLRPYKDYIPYSISKAGVISMTQGLAKALAPKVRVNAVGPGPAMFPEDVPETLARSMLEKTPLLRRGSPADVSAAVIFLVEGSEFLTGAFLPVDGGRIIA